LGFALSLIAFEESFDIPAGGLDMASQAVEEQLVRGWLEAEHGPGGAYRWASGHASAIVRVGRDASALRLTYRMPPGRTGTVTVSLRSLDAHVPAWSAGIDWQPGEWREESFPLALAGGDYLVSFDAQATWSNPGGADPDLPPENRALGIAVSRLSFA